MKDPAFAEAFKARRAEHALLIIRAVLNQGPHAYMLCEIREAVDSVLPPFSYYVGKPCP